MKKVFYSLHIILFATVGFAQQDDKAKTILDKASAKMDGYTTLSIQFGMTISSPDMDPVAQEGTLQLKGDKYKLTITDQEVYCDGKTLTTYLKADNECYVSAIENVEQDMASPEKLLTIWKDGDYRYRYAGTQDYANRPCDIIFLYPNQPKESKFHTVKLLIDQKKSEVVYAYIKGKDGTSMKHKLVSMRRDEAMPDQLFTFNPAQHPGVECYDE